MRRRSTAGVVGRDRRTNNVVRFSRTTSRGRGRRKRRRRKNRRRASAPVVDPVRQGNYQVRDMQDHRTIEKPNTILNERKIKLKWTNILSKLKTRSLRSELESVRNDHERKCDLRDQKTEELMKNVENVDLQTREAQLHHEKQLESFSKFQSKRIDILEKEFQRELASLIDEYEDELCEIEISSQTTLEELEDIENATKRRHVTKTERLENQGDMELYFVQKRYHQDIYVMKKALKERVEDLQENIDKETEIRGGRVKRVYKTYLRLREEYECLISKNRSDRIRIQKTTNQLNYWKAKWLHHVRESHIRNERLQEEVASIRSAFRSLKRKMENFQKEEQRKLVQLVKISNQCDKKLKTDINLGEGVLQAQRLVEELETERERMNLIYQYQTEDDEVDSISDDDNDGLKRMMSVDELLQKVKNDKTVDLGEEFTKVHEEMKHKEMKKQLKTFEPFFRKMNKVKLDNDALDTEKKRLNQQNRKLKRMLRSFLDGITVNEKVLRNRKNPLMIVQRCRVRVNVNAEAHGLKHR